MPSRVLLSIQIMNIISVVLFVWCTLHLLCHESRAETNGALTVVEQEDGDGVVESENGDGNLVHETISDHFHPTHEWQPVKKGQVIPAGLHVRLNLETGEKEAKLMDGESEFQYWKDGEREGMMNMDRKQLSMEELKRALKDFKTTQLDETDLQREDEVKKKFKSYEELKKDFEAMNMNIETDAEIIEGLFDKLKHPDTPRDDQLTILIDLEYYLHQIDNALLFKDMGGLPVIVKLLNATNDEQIQIEAARVLGAAMSSNPKVQIGGLESGALDLLVRLLSTQSSIKLRRRVLFALASQCRHFPFAQKRLLSNGGLTALAKLFDERETDKLQVKTLAFLNDLLIEKVLSEEHSNPEKSSEAEKLRQYQDVDLQTAMLEQGWCDRITHLLTLPDHDSRETTLNIMSTLSLPCQNTFLQSRDRLRQLEKEYRELAAQDNEEGDFYFRNIADLTRTLINSIDKGNGREVKEEL